MSQFKELLIKIFNDNLGIISKKRLYQLSKIVEPKITQRIVNEWYDSQPTNQIILKSGKKLPMHKIISDGRGWQADIFFIGDNSYKRANNGYIGLLTFINTSTRFAYVYPIKSRETSEISAGFHEFLKTVGSNITTLTTDKELFKNNRIVEMLREHVMNNIDDYTIDGNIEFIRHFTETPNTHSRLAIINRFHRTLRDGLNTHFIHNNTKRWIDVIDKIMNIYNSTPRRTTEYAPKDMTPMKIANLNSELRDEGLQAREGFNQFKVGDRVRHIIDRTNIIGKHVKRFSNEVFTIIDIRGFSFILKNEKGFAPRTYRYHELRKV